MGNKAAKPDEPVIVEETPISSPPHDEKIGGFKPESFFFLSHLYFRVKVNSSNCADLAPLHDWLLANNLIDTDKISHSHAECDNERFLEVKIKERLKSRSIYLSIDLDTHKATGYRENGYKFEELEDIEDFTREKADELALGLGSLLQFYL
jgi:hypothetical protein